MLLSQLPESLCGHGSRWPIQIRSPTAIPVILGVLHVRPAIAPAFCPLPSSKDDPGEGSENDLVGEGAADKLESQVTHPWELGVKHVPSNCSPRIPPPAAPHLLPPTCPRPNLGVKLSPPPSDSHLSLRPAHHLPPSLLPRCGARPLGRARFD